MKRNYLICYDIKDKKRLQRLHRKISQWTFMLQKSIYYLYQADDKTLDQVREMILSVIDPESDDVRIYKVLGAGIAWGDKAVRLDDPLLFGADF